MSERDAAKALRLAGRYARLRLVIAQRRKTSGRLFSACDGPVYDGDTEIGSACLAALSVAKNDGAYRYGRNGVENWSQVLDDIECCRACRIGLAVSHHRKRKLAKRLGAVLGSLRRIGDRVRQDGAGG